MKTGCCSNHSTPFIIYQSGGGLFEHRQTTQHTTIETQQQTKPTNSYPCGCATLPMGNELFYCVWKLLILFIESGLLLIKASIVMLRAHGITVLPKVVWRRCSCLYLARPVGYNLVVASPRASQFKVTRSTSLREQS